VANVSGPRSCRYTRQCARKSHLRSFEVNSRAWRRRLAGWRHHHVA
jgi:hypothetical protein